ncbi:response regulator rcp1 [Siphonobacter sp. BAB-5385]|uniref:response regulator n=1 Tax=Siphonobacter sp. BAB-5385 TaxID=1864822 RepID=UPI000B9DEC03|nr:response regulator [Siphonobacter sp. BAB-5385]OZI09808.1 response regulator rcp1 [Siphonobacter sp. BAB-5385]
MKQRVYLVDDDEDDRFFAEQGLSENADCEINFFTNGEELIHHLQCLSDWQFPTLIFLDLNMPRMNGFETLQVLKTNPQWGEIPVIILTTSSSTREREKVLALGAMGFLTKPSDFNRLTEVLASLSPCWRDEV